jgi:hypothetical protein
VVAIARDGIVRQFAIRNSQFATGRLDMANRIRHPPTSIRNYYALKGGACTRDFWVKESKQTFLLPITD